MIAFLLGIEGIGRQHGIKGNLRQRLSPVGQGMQQLFAVMGDHRLLQGSCGIPQGIIRRAGQIKQPHLAAQGCPKPGFPGAERKLLFPGKNGHQLVAGAKLFDALGRQLLPLGKPEVRLLLNRRGRSRFLGQAVGNGHQAILAQRIQPAGQPVGVAGVKTHGQRDIAPDGGQPFGKAGLFRVIAHLFAQLALDFFAMGQHIFQRAVLVQQLHRRLFTHTGHAGNVIAAVAHKALQVGDLGRRHAK